MPTTPADWLVILGLGSAVAGMIVGLVRVGIILGELRRMQKTLEQHIKDEEGQFAAIKVGQDRHNDQIQAIQLVNARAGINGGKR